MSGPQPLANLGDLVGKWTSKQTIAGQSYTPALNTNHNIDGSKSYDGFSADIATLASGNPMLNPIEAQRETGVRALAAVGNTRVWNLMIDVIAQTGRYPASASTLNNFVVEGEQRCWMHVAIDRCTGQVIDSKLEIVKE